MMPDMRKLGVAIVGLHMALVATNSSALSQYSHGTAVLALPTDNQILFAADSAMTFRNMTTYQTCKIIKVDGKTIFTEAGIGGIGRDDNSFFAKAAELVREKPIHTRKDLMSVAKRWNTWVIAQLDASMLNPQLRSEAPGLSPIEAVFATVDDNRNVVFVRSSFEIVDTPDSTATSSTPVWLRNLRFIEGDKGSQAYGLRYGDLEELRQQQTYWSRLVGSNAAFKPLLGSIDQPGDFKQKEANAVEFMTIVAPTSKQDNGTFAVGGETDIILLGPTGASWLKRKSVCPDVWK
jgi:ATP-dependent protease HslVU (ClpYQ) peptidase subunit